MSDKTAIFYLFQKQDHTPSTQRKVVSETARNSTPRQLLVLSISPPLATPGR
jgi:hypothetical protein